MFELAARLFELAARLFQLAAEACRVSVALGLDFCQARAQAEDGDKVFVGRLGPQIFLGSQCRLELVQAICLTPQPRAQGVPLAAELAQLDLGSAQALFELRGGVAA